MTNEEDERLQREADEMAKEERKKTATCPVNFEATRKALMAEAKKNPAD